MPKAYRDKPAVTRMDTQEMYSRAMLKYTYENGNKNEYQWGITMQIQITLI